MNPVSPVSLVAPSPRVSVLERPAERPGQPRVELRCAVVRTTRPTPRATVVLLQGRSEFVEKYRETLAELTAPERGFDVVTFDWRGQGASTRPLQNPFKGHIHDFETYLADLRAVVDEVVEPARRPGSGPLLMLSHSMGGHLGLRYQYAHPGRFVGAVHLAPMLGLHLPVVPRLAAALMRAGVALGAGARFVSEPERTADTMCFETNLLTRDAARFEAVRDCLRQDPALALGGPTLAWVDAALRSIDTLVDAAVARRIVDPMMLVVAGGDRVVDNRATERFARLAPRARLEIVCDAEHEILIERDACRRDFWCAFDAFVGRLIE